MGLEQDAETAILRWMNSIRFQMAMDPARQYFEDQIYEHGLNFLDDYWESILVGPQDPIVELLKTPGRKRVSPMKPRTNAEDDFVPRSETLSIIAEDDELERTRNSIRHHQSMRLSTSIPATQPAYTPSHPPAPTAYAPASPDAAKLARKPSINSFPPLSNTMPFRKSLRVFPESSIVAPVVVGNGGAGPGGAVAGGKRTSWLAKAREAKAIDENALKSGSGAGLAAAIALGGKTPGLKRRSTGSKTQLEEERQPKVAKIVSDEAEVDHQAATQKPHGRKGVSGDSDLAPQPERHSPPLLTPTAEQPIQSVVRQPSPTPANTQTPTDDEDHVLDGFKRMVQGLGVRAGKSMGKSLGGPAAAHALAKARAAAEARVAEREGWAPPPARPSGISPVPTANDTDNQPTKETEMPQRRSSEKSSKRLSVSDLVTAFEASKAETATHETAVHEPAPPLKTFQPALNLDSGPSFKRDKISITPPSSPPSEMPPLAGPVFKPGERVFVPLPRSQAKETPSTLSSSTAFSKRSPIALSVTTCYDDMGSIPGAFEMDMDLGQEEVTSDEELQEIVRAGKTTVGLVANKTDREAGTQSQLSMASSASSSQMNLGILGQFVNSVLGTSKPKPEVKSLQLAAAAAKKQQEEKDKKAARLKEMENRRLLVSQKKVEEEKARAAERERKIREETERRRREREEQTDKRPLKTTSKKAADEENTQKRKLVTEAEKKPESKKPPSKDTKTTKIAKPNLNAPTTLIKANPTKSALKQPTVLGDLNRPKTPAIPTSPTKGKSKAVEDDVAQPSRVLQSQMAARAKARMHGALPVVSTENIELPDINSEYSDSEDEDRPRAFDPPDWAQSPELRQALQQQSTVNPDDIFGEIQPFRIEDMFKKRRTGFRARTSSANWTGADRLTEEEQREYARRMGFNKRVPET